MVMGNEPFAAILDEKHGKPRRSWYRLTALHAGKLVKASNYYGVVIEYHCVSFANGVLISTSF
jgi:hypothetical protein